MSELTITGALARAVSKLRAVSAYQKTSGNLVEHDETDALADALEVHLNELADVPNVGTVEPGALVSFLRGLPPAADASRAWIRQLRGAIEITLVEHQLGVENGVGQETNAVEILSGFDRLLAELIASEDRTAERIAAFLDILSHRAARYLVTPDAIATLRAAASDILDGRWRRP